jgi:hypothetical protein
MGHTADVCTANPRRTKSGYPVDPIGLTAELHSAVHQLNPGRGTRVVMLLARVASNRSGGPFKPNPHPSGWGSRLGPVALVYHRFCDGCAVFGCWVQELHAPHSMCNCVAQCNCCRMDGFGRGTPLLSVFLTGMENSYLSRGIAGRQVLNSLPSLSPLPSGCCLDQILSCCSVSAPLPRPSAS